MARTLPFDPSSTPVYGQWAGIAKTSVDVLLASAGAPGASALTNTLFNLAQLGEAQAELLASIKNDTRLLREEPFRTARTLLAEAYRVGPGDSRHLTLLQDALNSLYRARSLADSSRELAMVEFDIFLVFGSMRKQPDALHWLRQSRESARRAIDELAYGFLVPNAPLYGWLKDERPTARFDLRNSIRRNSIAAALGAAAGITLVGGVVIAARKARQLQRGRGAAEDLVAFVNMVEYVAAAAFHEQFPRPLEIVSRFEGDTLRLREIDS